MSKSHKSRLGLLLTASGAVLMAGYAAQAQTTNEATASVGEVVVTASRVAREGFSAPTPTTVIGQAQIEARSPTNIAETINESPAFRPSATPAAAARGGGASGGSFLDLRGLNGATVGSSTARTLVLVDGRRHVSYDPAARVDINLIPTQLVERTEVVTGGASAAWGSDAIAGVVNLILKDRLQGIQGNLSYGQSSKSDNEEYAIGLAGGTAFAGGRGHVIAGFDYVDSKGVPDAFLSRDWGRDATATLSLNPRPAGIPARVILGDVRLSDRLSPGGVIVGGPLDNIEFTGGQGTRIFTPGTFVGGNQMAGGGANNSNAGVYFTGGSNLVNPIKRWTALGRARYDITDSISGFVEYSHAESEFNGRSASRRDDASLIIRRDNAFLPESVRNQMTALNLPTITVGRVAYDNGFGFYPTHTDSELDRGVIGLNGKLFGDWKWDAYYQAGRSHYVQNNVSTINSNYLAAVDAVVVNGQIVCRPVAPNATGSNVPDAGCVPFNIFGQNSPSQAAINYVSGVGVNDVTVKQQVAAFNINGDLFTLPAGPVSVAAGLEFRKEEANSKVDARSAASRFDLNNFQPINGKYDTKEIYGEVVVPVLKDTAFAKTLELNGAARRTDYSTSGAVTTWKIGGVWEPIDQIRFRSTLSRDIRAPNLNELFAGTLTGRVAVINPNTLVSTQVDLLTSSNRNLKPEKADTFTLGLVLQPTLIPRLRFSADYFDINIKGVIGRLAQQDVVDRCANGSNTALCSDVIYANPATITSVVVRQLNLSGLNTSGIDLELSYSLAEGTFVPGQFNFRALGTFTADLATTDAAGRVDRAKQTVPEWTGNFTTIYNLDRFSANVQMRYVGATVVDVLTIGPNDARYNPASPLSTSDNTRPAVVYFNLGANYDIITGENGRRVQIYGVANNITDRDPPAGGGGNAIGAALYDLVGRSYRVGVRFNY